MHHLLSLVQRVDGRQRGSHHGHGPEAFLGTMASPCARDRHTRKDTTWRLPLQVIVSQVLLGMGSALYTIPSLPVQTIAWLTACSIVFCNDFGRTFVLCFTSSSIENNEPIRKQLSDRFSHSASI